MKKLLVSLLLLAASASCAAATSLNLGWMGTDPCPSQPGSLRDLTDLCNDNAGNHVLVGSVVAPAGLTQVTGEEAWLNLIVDAPTVPDFWHLELGGCRDGSLYVEAVFTGFATTACRNYWGTAAQGGYNWTSNWTPDQTYSPNRATLQMVYARAFDSAGPMTEGMEYYVFRAFLDDAHVVDDGSGVCAGCSLPACFVWTRLRLTQPVGVGDVDIRDPIVGYVTWQGGSPNIPCPAATPARRSTWGQVKTLYR